MTQSKIQGKFYPLQHNEWLKACHELTPAQRDVLYFIRTLDPYGESVEVSIAEIARQLSTDKKIVHRSTVSRALKELDAKGFIDMDLIKVKVNIKGKGVHCCDETTRCDETTMLSTDNKRDHDATSVIVTQQARSPRNKRAPEPLSEADSKSLRSNKTYTDFKDSLSETEREKFFEFALKKATELPKPPTLPEKWMEKHHQELYEQFKQTPEGQKVAPSQDWANHPKREEWIAEIRIGRPRFIALGGPKEEQEIRKQFAKWACDNNLVWGTES